MPSSNHITHRARTAPGSFRIFPLGDLAITIEFGAEIDAQINVRVVANTAATE